MGGQGANETPACPGKAADYARELMRQVAEENKHQKCNDLEPAACAPPGVVVHIYDLDFAHNAACGLDKDSADEMQVLQGRVGVRVEASCNFKPARSSC